MKSKNYGLIVISLLAAALLCVNIAPGISEVQTQTVASAETAGVNGWVPTYNGSYYDNVNSDKTGNALRDELYERISSPHNNTSYSGLSDAYRTADADPNNAGNILWFYSGTSVKFNGSFGSNPGTTNREHVWPKNGGDAFPEKSGPGSDAHHLRACEAQLNSTRGSKSYDEVAQTSSNLVKEAGKTSYGSGADSLCYSSGSFFYPGKGYRGATARILFYVQTRWGNQYNLSFVDGAGHNKTIGKISTLLKWHLEEPPTEEEVRRNEAVFKLQQNRNPFIDHPEYAALIYCNDGNSYNNALRAVVAEYGNYNDQMPEIEELKITPSSLDTLVKGQSVTLSAQAVPQGANNDVTWTTSDSGVAKVDANGKVTAVESGTATITATSKENPGVKATVTVKVKSVTGISLQGLPNKKVYDVGDVFDPTGITVKLIYSDGSQSAVNNGLCKWLDANSNTERLTKGSTSVKCVYEGFEAEYSGITVRYVTGITVSGTPKLLSYAAGQSFNPEGLTVKAVFNNGDTAPVELDNCVWLDNNGSETFTERSVSVVCKYGVYSANVDAEIFIKIAQRIEVSGNLLKTEYVLGSKFDPAGLKVTVHFNDATAASVNLSDCRFVDEKGNEIPAKTAKKITCFFGEHSCEVPFEILVKELVGIKLTGVPLKIEYGFGDTFEPNGLTVTAEFDNGGSDEKIELTDCQWLDNNGNTRFDGDSTSVKCVYKGKEAVVDGVRIDVSAAVREFIQKVSQIDTELPLQARFETLKELAGVYASLSVDEKQNSAVIEAYQKLKTEIERYNADSSVYNDFYGEAAKIGADAIARTMLALLSLAFIVKRIFN